MNKLKLTVSADSQADTQFATAFLMVAFRKMGVMPTVTSKNTTDLMRLAADEMTIGALLVNLIHQDGYVVTIDDGSVQAPKAVLTDDARAVIQAAADYLRDVRTGTDSEVEAWDFAAKLDGQLK